MAGKKDSKDVLQGFFGDDFDNLMDDDESEIRERPSAKATERLPLAPAPNTPFVPASQVGRFGPAAPASAAPRPAPLPTLPPMPSMFSTENPPEEPTQEDPTEAVVDPALAGAPRAFSSKGAISMPALPSITLAPEPAPTMVPEPEPEPEPVVEPARIQVSVSASVVPAGARTAAPPSARTGAPAGARTAAPIPVVRPAAPPPLESWSPRGDEQEWRDAAAALERAGERVHAARVLRVAGDRAAADALLERAVVDGGANTASLIALTEAAVRRQEFDKALEFAGAWAGSTAGAEASDAMQQAADIAYRRLAQPDRAVEFLRRAAATEADALPAWSAISAIYADLGREEERIEALAHVERLSAPEIAAEAATERGRLLQRLGQDSKVALEAALALSPSHTPAFLALEAILSPGEKAALHVREAERLGSSSPDAGWYAWRAARVFEALDDRDAAERAWALAATLPAARRDRCRALESHGALHLASEAWALEAEHSPWAWFEVGRIQELAGAPEKALESYKKAAGTPDAGGAAQACIARLSLRMESVEDRLSRLRAQRSDPGTAQRLAWAGWIAGDLDAAAEGFEAAGASDPMWSAVGTALVAWRRGNGAVAESAFLKLANSLTGTAQVGWLQTAAISAGGVPSAATVAIWTKVLEQEPTFDPARWAILAAGSVDGDWQRVAQVLERLAANPRLGRSSAAAVRWEAGLQGADGLADGDDPLSLALRSAFVERAQGGRPEPLPEPDAAALALRGASEGGGVTALTTVPLDSQGPLRYIAQLAESEGMIEFAAEVLANSKSPEDRLQRARLLLQAGDTRGALAQYRELLEDPAVAVPAAAAIAATTQGANDLSLLARAYSILVDRTQNIPQKAAYAAWLAAALESHERPAEAAKFWLSALSVRPTESARRGAERSLLACGDVAGIQALHAEDAVPLAFALAELGEEEAACAVWRSQPNSLVATLHLEQLAARTEDWATVYDAVNRRLEYATDAEERERLEAKRRWLLVERLSKSELAWDLYRKLHEDRPADRDVTEALARIAISRQETGLAIQFLRELVDGAASKAEAARFQRRIGEAYEAASDVASARQAFLDALDHVPDDGDALGGLKRLAEKSQDWRGLVSVLQRQVGLTSGNARVDLRREIARVNEVQLADPAVAVDAWRAVLEEVPHDLEALEHLVALAIQTKEPSLMMESGKALLPHKKGDERIGLARRLGEACAAEGQIDDAIRYLEEALWG